jgi:hypothetical protein
VIFIWEMISFSDIMRKVLTETMSFVDLWRRSDPARKVRARHMYVKSLGVTTMDNNEAWTFSYKSKPRWSTTGNRWQGYVRFLKENVEQSDSAKDLQCMVDCTCPDYRYRWAYRNAEAGAGAIGPNAWNDNNGQPPKTKNTDLGTGMCKHLISLGEYLKTQWEPTDPVSPKPVQPAPAPPTPTITPAQPSTPSVSTSKVAQAPEPPKKTASPYSDTRSGDMLEERKGSLFERISNFVKMNPQFEVKYEDEEK